MFGYKAMSTSFPQRSLPPHTPLFLTKAAIGCEEYVNLSLYSTLSCPLATSIFHRLAVVLLQCQLPVLTRLSPISSVPRTTRFAISSSRAISSVAPPRRISSVATFRLVSSGASVSSSRLSVADRRACRCRRPPPQGCTTEIPPRWHPTAPRATV